MSWLRPREETRPWGGAYAPYDLVKEATIAVGVVALLAIVLSILFSSPDVKPSTIAQWSRQLPVNFLSTASKELDETSATAEYGPPYNNASGSVQHILFLHLQEWLGVSHPIHTATEYVVDPLRTIPNDPALSAALSEYEAASAKTRKGWGESYAKPFEEVEKAEEEGKTPPSSVSSSGETVTVRPTGAGPVPKMMESLLALAQSGGLDGSLLTSRQFFQTDYTKPLLFMADGGLLEKRAEQDHLLGEQWGIMNETGSYPGQVWLWLYTLWYQVEPIKSSASGDAWVIFIMLALSLLFIFIPFLPIVNRLPRWIPIYRVIWREHYRAAAAALPPPPRAPPTAGGPPPVPRA